MKANPLYPILYSNHLMKDRNDSINKALLVLNAKDHLSNHTNNSLHYWFNSLSLLQLSPDDKNHSTKTLLYLTNVATDLMNHPDNSPILYKNNKKTDLSVNNNYNRKTTDMKQALSTNFVPYNDADFFAFASQVVFNMHNNPHFPEPVPPLNTISELVNEFENALSDAATKNKVDIAVKNTLRKQLEHQLKRLALYVMYMADDEVAILLSSGYNLTKKPEGNKLAEPGVPMLTSVANSSEIMSAIKAVKGAKFYLHEISTDPFTPNAIWETHSCSRRKFTFTNLTSGQKYWIRVAVLGTGKQKVYSPMASLWAQ